MDFIHLNQRVGRGGAGRFSEKEWKKVYSLFSFAYSVSFLDPESSLREDLQSVSKGGAVGWGGGPTFLEAPGQKLACGVPTFLSCWGHQVEKLVGLKGASVAVGGAVALESVCCFVCVSALCLCRSRAAQQSSRLEESLCGGGLGRFLWICSELSLGRGSEGDSGRPWVIWQRLIRHIHQRKQTPHSSFTSCVCLFRQKTSDRDSWQSLWYFTVSFSTEFQCVKLIMQRSSDLLNSYLTYIITKSHAQSSECSLMHMSEHRSLCVEDIHLICFTLLKSHISSEWGLWNHSERRALHSQH